MGAIKRGFANNILTSGNFDATALTGTIANGNLSDNTMKLLGESVDFSGVTQVNFDNTVITGSGYDNILIIWETLICATDGDEPIISVSADNGSSFYTFSNSRIWRRMTGVAATGVEQEASVTYIRLQTNAGNDANRGLNLMCWLPGANRSVGHKSALYQCVGQEQTNPYTWNGGAFSSASSGAINYLRVSTIASGNISGTVRVYGY
jgi:hypothetical protein